jgi:hypothetical protein
MDDIDISREAVQTALKQFAMQLLSDYGVAGDIPRSDPDFSNCLFAEADAICSIFSAALDAAEASERKAVDRAVALTFANDVLQAKLEAAEAEKAAAVEAMREAAIDAIKAIWSDVVEEMAEFGLEHPAQAEIDAIRTGAKP